MDHAEQETRVLGERIYRDKKSFLDRYPAKEFNKSCYSQMSRLKAGFSMGELGFFRKDDHEVGELFFFARVVCITICYFKSGIFD